MVSIDTSALDMLANEASIRTGFIHIDSIEYRKGAISRYLYKRNLRNWNYTILYNSRSEDSKRRTRSNGRFAKIQPTSLLLHFRVIKTHPDDGLGDPYQVIIIK